MAEYSEIKKAQKRRSLHNRKSIQGDMKDFIKYIDCCMVKMPHPTIYKVYGFFSQDEKESSYTVASPVVCSNIQ